MIGEIQSLAMARRTQFVLVMVFLNSILVNRAESEYGFTFDAYEGRSGESLYLDCVTNTATLESFTYRNLRGEQREFYYSTSPTILQNYKYLLYKRRYSKLLHVYSLIITRLDYNDEGDYYCHLSDGRMSRSRVVVTGRNNKWHHIFFAQPDYVVKKNTRALLTCFRPLGQKFGRFYFRKDANGHRKMINNRMEGYRIQQDNIYNTTWLKFLLSDSTKIGLYECSAGGERTLTKVSMKCDIPDTTFKSIIVRRGDDGYLKVKWVGDMVQQGMLTTWEKVPSNMDVSTWHYGNQNEVAARLNSKFYATISSKYGIDEDGTLIIKATSKVDAGYYKFRLVCGKDVEKSLLISVSVID